jgi:hypothetical protein
VDDVVVVASLVAALAAAGAVGFAYLTVRDARAFHAESERERHRERLRVIGRTVGELWALANSVAAGAMADVAPMDALRRQLGMELVGVSDALPSCRSMWQGTVTDGTTVYARGGVVAEWAPYAFVEVEAAIRAVVEPPSRPPWWRRWIG